MTSQRPQKIFVVEDEPDIAELGRHYLEKEGFHPSIAKTGLEGLAFTRSLWPDLVILDLMLPQMEGFEVCKAAMEIAAAANWSESPERSHQLT
ncbi:response regulator [Nitrospira sp. CMX1]